MSNIAVIAEYNPYHNGHKYLIEEAKKITDSENAIALMSGSFIQRGAPAVADKYARAESAILGGMDIVFELPVLYSTGSARDFALGGVAILNKLNSIDYLAFGVENKEEQLFDEISTIFSDEPDEYKELLNSGLSKGLSYPNASEKAIKKILGIKSSEAISKPNNILAISYLTALKKTKSSIKPIMIERCDKGYDYEELTGKYSSATAIRKALENHISVFDYIPKECPPAFREYDKKPLPSEDWLTPIIAARLIYDRNLPPEISNLKAVLDMTPELLNRLRKAPLPIKYIELQDYLKTKNITMTRLSRVMLHMVLGIQHSDRELAQENGHSEYINLLAFRNSKSSLLKEMTDASSLTVINKKSTYTPETPLGQRMWQLDKLATDLYNQLIYENQNIRLHNELSSNVRIIK